MKLHPGKFFGLRNPKIKFRDTEDEEKKHYFREKAITDVCAEAYFGWNQEAQKNVTVLITTKKYLIFRTS